MMMNLQADQQLGLTSAPTVQYHPAATGPNKSNKLSVVTYDLNRQYVPSPLPKSQS
jgi:oligosaccharyltransferase complex subunit gamma